MLVEVLTTRSLPDSFPVALIRRFIHVRDGFGDQKILHDFQTKIRIIFCPIVLRSVGTKQLAQNSYNCCFSTKFVHESRNAGTPQIILRTRSGISAFWILRKVQMN